MIFDDALIVDMGQFWRFEHGRLVEHTIFKKETNPMGMIKITVAGSFNSASNHGHKLAGDQQTVQFSAMTHGHAHAVQEAIAYLTNTVLPVAINLDHELHDDGDKPIQGFAKPYADAPKATVG